MKRRIVIAILLGTLVLSVPATTGARRPNVVSWHRYMTVVAERNEWRTRATEAEGMRQSDGQYIGYLESRIAELESSD